MARLAVWAAAAAAAGAGAQGFALKHRLDFTFDVPPGVDTIKVRLLSDSDSTQTPRSESSRVTGRAITSELSDMNRHGAPGSYNVRSTEFTAPGGQTYRSLAVLVAARLSSSAVTVPT
jgi:hypothetical protein